MKLTDNLTTLIIINEQLDFDPTELPTEKIKSEINNLKMKNS